MLLFQSGYGALLAGMRKGSVLTAPPLTTPHHSATATSESAYHCPTTGTPGNRKSYFCTLCDKSFANSSNLNRHMQIHTGKYSYYCQICRKGFNETNNYKAHMNKHEGRSFPCQFCNNRYSSERSMKDHMRAVHGKV